MSNLFWRPGSLCIHTDTDAIVCSGTKNKLARHGQEGAEAEVFEVGSLLIIAYRFAVWSQFNHAWWERQRETVTDRLTECF